MDACQWIVDRTCVTVWTLTTIMSFHTPWFTHCISVKPTPPNIHAESMFTINTHSHNQILQLHNLKEVEENIHLIRYPKMQNLIPPRHGNSFSELQKDTIRHNPTALRPQGETTTWAPTCKHTSRFHYLIYHLKAPICLVPALIYKIPCNLLLVQQILLSSAASIHCSGLAGCMVESFELSLNFPTRNKENILSRIN